MSIERREFETSSSRTAFTSCPLCETPLDEAGGGTEFPDHYEHRCPANPEVAND